MFVEVQLYFPAKDASLLFANQDAADYEDYSSSLVVPKDSKLPGLEGSGYYLVSGKFIYDQKDYGLGSGLRRQFGIIDLNKVRKVTSIAERQADCDSVPDCVAKFSRVHYDEASSRY